MSAIASLTEETAADPAHRIAVAAHEIRTPLGGILALADLILSEDLPENARGHANALKSAAEHLFGVASTLLGGPGPVAATMDVERFIARVSPAIAARAAAKGLAFRVIRARDTPDRVTADESALRQIVENLADNALRVTERGSIELLVERVSGDDDTVTLRLAVRDTGPGVGPEPERLFTPYVQGSGEVGAKGLGLSLVQAIAARMHGHADASDRPSGGAEVGVTVRLGAVDRPGRGGGAIRVLVAEDNVINQRVVGTLLEHFGHGYDIVGNGADAVAAVGGGAYDLVLMDAVMPTLDGLSATRAIRAMGGSVGRVRIVGLTAHAFDEDIAAFMAAGADAVVTKPISVAELWRALDAGAERMAG